MTNLELSLRTRISLAATGWAACAAIFAICVAAIVVLGDGGTLSLIAVMALVMALVLLLVFALVVSPIIDKALRTRDR